MRTMLSASLYGLSLEVELLCMFLKSGENKYTLRCCIDKMDNHVDSVEWQSTWIESRGGAKMDQW